VGVMRLEIFMRRLGLFSKGVYLSGSRVLTHYGPSMPPLSFEGAKA